MPVVRGGDLSYVSLPGRASANPLPVGIDLGCSVRVVRIAPGPRTPHRHPKSAEVVYVVEGTGAAWEDEQRTLVGPGDLIAVPPGVPHATVAAGTSDLVLVCFFPDADLAANLEELTGPIRE